MNGAPEKDRDRNLLFGVLAVQLKGVSPHQVIEAASAWMVSPDKPLSERLLQIGAITTKDAEIINGLVDEAVRLHSGDVSAALDGLPGSENLRQSLTAASMGQRPPVDATRPMDTRFNFGETEVELSALDETPGRYSFVSEHGRGGMGRVLLVHDEYLGRDIALKELLLPHDTDPPGPQPSPMRESTGLLARFLQEARITGQLEHPAIIPVYELGRRVNGTLYYTMKLVRGKTLSTMIRNAGTLEKRLALLSSVVDLCQAIAYAHSRGVIHRDIKPSNLMVGEFGETVVLDWGLARVEGQDDAYEEKFKSTLAAMRIKRKDKGGPVTSTGEALGTPHYMPPEQAEGRVRELDQRSDIYSVGAVLYELLTGQPPYDGRSAEDILMQVLQANPKPIKELAPDAPDELVSICEKALQKDPAKRYQKLTDMRDDIRAFQTGAMVSVATYSTGDMLRRYYRAHRTVINAGLASAAALLIMGVYSYFNILAARDREYTQRLAAEDAARKETIARKEEADARVAESEARAEAERKAYLSEIHLAQSYLDQQNSLQANNVLWATDTRQRGWEWAYLLNQANPEIFTVETPDSELFVARFNPDGNSIATLSYPDPIQIWDPLTGKLLRKMNAETKQYTNFHFNGDGSLIVAPSVDGFIDVWNSVSGERVQRFINPPSMAVDAKFGPDGFTVYAAYDDNAARSWDTRSGELMQTFTMETGSAWQVDPSPDSKKLVVSGRPGVVSVWDLSENKIQFAVPGREGYFSPDGKRLAVLHIDTNDVAIFDVPTGTLLHSLNGHNQAVFTARFSADGTQLVTASFDTTARLWDIENGREIALCDVDNRLVDAFFAKDGQYIVTCEGSNTFTLWNPAIVTPEQGVGLHAQKIHKMESPGVALTVADLAPDGVRMVTASAEKSFQLWNVTAPSGNELLDLEQKKIGAGETTAFDVTPDALILSSFRTNGTIFVPEDDTKPSTLYSALGNPRYYRLHAYAPDESLLATTPDGYTVVLWNPAGPEIRSVLQGHEAPLTAVEFAPNHDLLTASKDGTARIWDTDTGQTRFVLDGHNDKVTDAAYSSDGRFAFTCSEDGRLLRWDAATGNLDLELADYEKGLNVLACSPDGTRVVCGGADGVTRVLDARTGQLERQLTQSTNRLVNKLEYTAGGHLLSAYIAYDGMYLWDGVTLDSLVRLGDSVGHAYVSPDLDRTVLATTTGQLQIVRSAPWTETKQAGLPNADWRAQFEEYRLKIAAESDTDFLSTRDRNVQIIANADILRNAITMLAERVDTVSTDSAIETDGLCLAQIPDVATALGLDASNCITTIDGVKIGAAASEQLASLQEELEASDTPALRFDVRNAGNTHSVVYTTLPVAKTLDLKQTLDQSDATTLLRGVSVMIARVENYGTAPMFGIFSDTDMEKFGVATKLTEQDQISAVNGISTKNVSTALEELDRLLNLPTAEAAQFTLTIERGLFKKMNITYTITHEDRLQQAVLVN